MMARYQKVFWHHDFDEEPVLLYSEVDDDGMETRKVDVYRNERLDFADGSRSTGTTVLSEKTMPSLGDIKAQPMFEAEEITREDFETVWIRATMGG